MAAQSSSSVISRPLNIYSLPPPLLDALSVRTIRQPLPPPPPTADAQPALPPVEPLGGGSLTCQSCPGASFDSVEEQRGHFRSDWHRYNVKARLNGRAVGEKQWEGMVEDLSSISGSASSSSSSSDGESSQASDSKLTRLLKRQQLSSSRQKADDGDDSDEAAELADRQRRAHLRTALIWFTPTSSPLPQLGIDGPTQFGVYRALFEEGYREASEYLGGLKELQLEGQGRAEGEERRITMLMVAGGHFAGMVVGLKPRGPRDKIEVKGAGEVRVLQHKTFHRYTTRKKQGGSQALNDNAKSKAVSAGAMLRRYGEQALQEEIRALMTDWAEDIDQSERVFVRASTHGKKSFWGYEGAVLEKNDPRIRVFPFPTRRPTLQELLRCWHELTRVKVSHLSEDALREMDEAYIASLQPKAKPVKPTQQPAPAPAPAQPKLSPEEEAKVDRQRRLKEMIQKGRLDALKPFWGRYRDDFSGVPGLEALGLAASSGQEEVVRWFLEEGGVDPAIPLDSGATKRAYDLASDRGMRNVFRRVAVERPELWDWAAARVPAGLGEEAEEKREAKRAERRKGLKEKMKAREAARKDGEQEDEGGAEGDKVEEVVPAKNGEAQERRGGPQKLGGKEGGEGLGGMSREMREKIERERRARAAEARFGRA